MLMNLFSVFDPVSYFGVSLNWGVIFMVLCLGFMKYYVLCGGGFGGMKLVLQYVAGMFKEIGGLYHTGLVFMCVMTFMYLVVSNLLGLFPFIFTSTAHPLVTMGVGLIYWLSFFIYGWGKNFKNSAGHLVPEGSPLFLSPVMVLIETISHLMRPFTLSIRLAANMMAGHLIVGLLASISTLGLMGVSSSVFLQGVLLVLEFGVSVIQGFVFSILIMLYAVEYY